MCNLKASTPRLHRNHNPRCRRHQCCNDHLRYPVEARCNLFTSPSLFTCHVFCDTKGPRFQNHVLTPKCSVLVAWNTVTLHWTLTTVHILREFVIKPTSNYEENEGSDYALWFPIHAVATTSVLPKSNISPTSWSHRMLYLLTNDLKEAILMQFVRTVLTWQDSSRW